MTVNPNSSHARLRAQWLRLVGATMLAATALTPATALATPAGPAPDISTLGIRGLMMGRGAAAQQESTPEAPQFQRGGGDGERGGGRGGRGGWNRGDQAGGNGGGSRGDGGGRWNRGGGGEGAGAPQARPAPVDNGARGGWNRGGDDAGRWQRRGGGEDRGRWNRGDNDGRWNRGGAANGGGVVVTPPVGRTDRGDGSRINRGDWDRTNRGDWNRTDRGNWSRGNDGRWDRGRDGDGRRWDGRRDGDQRWDGRRNDDRRWDNRVDNRRWDRRDDRRWDRGDNRRWDREWRRDRRYDWYAHRSYNRDLFRWGRYASPYRNWNYRRISIGFSLWPLFYSERYWINDPWQYRLPDAWGPYRWVRYYDDALLVDIRTGEVVDAIDGFFW